jgi:glycosyltransferase involved in cell wall biosynthesis
VRILFLTPFLPNPEASHGGGSYLGALAAGLREHAELGLVHLRHPDEGPVDPSVWNWQACSDYVGTPRGRGHQSRMLWRWRNRPLLVAKYWQPQLLAHIRRALQEFQPDAVLVELAQMAQYLPSLNGLPCVLTDHEAGRPANSRTGLGAIADRRDARLWRRYVQRRYAQASMLQAVTEEDARSLMEQTGREVLVRPPTLSIPVTACQPAQAPAHALFLGDYRHAPNPTAAIRLATEVWPLVLAAKPDAKLLLAGPHEQAIRHLDQLPGVRVLGFVPDLTKLLGDTRVVLAPLWTGAGFRVKNATALAHGLPIVTNELGSRGCCAPSPACSIAASNEELAQATLQHLRSPEFASAAGDTARTWALRHYAAEAVAQLQMDRLRQLLARNH